MTEHNLSFLIANDATPDMDLNIEAWSNDVVFAELRRMDGQWEVWFFAPPEGLTLAWTEVEEVHRRFQAFIDES